MIATGSRDVSRGGRDRPDKECAVYDVRKYTFALQGKSDTV